MHKFIGKYIFFKTDQIYMKDVECAETNEKLIFSFWDMTFFVLKICQFLINIEYKIDHKSNKNI